MTPILYDASEQDYTTLGLGALNDAISCNVHTVLNGVFELEMQYPTSGKRYSDLKISNIIKAVAQKGGSEQLFDIYSITKPISGVVTVYASHMSGRKQFIPVMPCNATTVTTALQTIKSHSAEDNPFTFWTDKTTVANFNLKTPASLGSVLGGMEGSILDTYGGEYEFDNFTIRLWNRRGQDNGVSLRYGKNITDIEQEESIADTVTGICPFWADEDGNTVTLPEKTVDSDKAANFPFKRTIVKDFSMDFDEKPTVAQLRSHTQSYIASNNIGIPDVGLDVSYENLADYEEYQDVAILEQVRLGDTAHVYFEPLDITADARVTETYYNVILDKYDRVRIGTVKSSLSSVINSDVKTANANVANTKNSLEIAFEKAIDLLAGADGGNIIINRNEVTGTPYEILIMDTADVSTARKVLRLNDAGFGYSSNGINGPYALAGTGEGFVAEAITSGFLDAARIKANSIAVSKLTGNITNGNWKIDLDNGTFTIGNISANNITTGTLAAARIAANSIAVSKLTGSISNGQWKIDLDNGTMTLGKLAVGSITGNIVNGNWKVDFDNGTFSIGNISANNITTGTLSADRIGANSISVSKLTGSISGGNNWNIDLTNGTISIGNISANSITAGTITADVTATNFTMTGGRISVTTSNAQDSIIELNGGPYLNVTYKSHFASTELGLFGIINSTSNTGVLLSAWPGTVDAIRNEGSRHYWTTLSPDGLDFHKPSYSLGTGNISIDPVEVSTWDSNVSIKLDENTYLDAQNIAGFKGTISSGNLNDYRYRYQSGMYYVGSGVTNAPADYGMMIMISTATTGNGVCRQLYIIGGSIYSRSYTGSGSTYTWSSWYKYTGTAI